MHGDVDIQRLRQVHQFSAHRLLGGQRPADRKLYTRPRQRVRLHQRHTPRKPRDHVDVQAVVGAHRSHRPDLLRRQLAPHDRHDPPRLPLLRDPMLILVERHRRKSHLDFQVVRRQQQVLHDLGPHLLRRYLDQNPQRQRLVDDGLTDVQDHHRMSRQRPRQRGNQTGPVASRHVDQKDFTHRLVQSANSS